VEKRHALSAYPSTKHSSENLSNTLKNILREEEIHVITVGDFFDRMKDRGLEMVILMIALPFCQPIPLLGLSTPFGFLLAALGFRVCMRWNAWAPRNIKLRVLPKGFINMMRKYAVPWAIWIEKWIKPRLLFLSESKLICWIHGFNIIALALLLSLPFPIPFSNVIVAWPIVMLALGLLERDGFLILLAYTLSLAAYAFFIVIFYFGIEAIKRWLGI
jgi:hypothetical protein